jgi:pimeloyl-ACP methyl ester carboxylesterase
LDHRADGKNIMGKLLKATGFLPFPGKVSTFTVQGLDWHGPSARDVWESLDALTTLLEKAVYGFPGSWGIARNTQVLMMGHSNGGQGTWYLSSRYPDRILGGRECGVMVSM